MATHAKKGYMPAAPTDTAIFYPEEDGQPMAASDRHRAQLIRTLHALETYFTRNPDTYVSGDILMYYVEGDPRRVVSPDVLVTFGIGQKPRGTYKVWEEGKVPDFVMEFSSKSTYQNDLRQKLELYAALRIPDYFLYDAEGLYLPSPLMGFELIEGIYIPISSGTSGELRSSSLGLEFYMRDADLEIYDPVAGEWLQTPAEREAARADTAEARAVQETARADTAEAEAARLREQLARLQTQNR